MTTKLAIIAYANLTETGQESVQAIRAQHDPQFGILDPHFTLVFPIESPQNDLVKEAESVAKGVAPFRFTLHSVQAVREPLGDGGHVFLVPEQGAGHVNVLHARLYGGALNWALRADIPYVPHITVAAYPDFQRCEALVEQLVGTQKDVHGWVAALTVVELTRGGVTTVAVSPLTGVAEATKL